MIFLDTATLNRLVLDTARALVAAGKPVGVDAVWRAMKADGHKFPNLTIGFAVKRLKESGEYPQPPRTRPRPPFADQLEAVREAAAGLVAEGQKPNRDPIHKRVVAAGLNLTRDEVGYAVRTLRDRGEFPGAVRSSPAAPVAVQAEPGKPKRVYLGRFARDMKRIARLRRHQRRLAVRRTGEAS